MLELVVCVVVVGVLAAIALFGYRSVQSNAKDAVALENVKQWAQSVGGTAQGQRFGTSEVTYNGHAREAIASFRKNQQAGVLVEDAAGSSEQPWQIAVRLMSVVFVDGADVVLSSALRAPDTGHCAQAVSTNTGKVLVSGLDTSAQASAVGGCTPLTSSAFAARSPVAVVSASLVAVPGQSEPASAPAPTPTASPTPTPTPTPTSSGPSATVVADRVGVYPWQYLRVSGVSDATPSGLVYLWVKRPGASEFAYVMWASRASNGAYLFDHINGGTVLDESGPYVVMVSSTAYVSGQMSTYTYNFG